MKKVISLEYTRQVLNLTDNIVYSRQQDLDGTPLELKLSILKLNGKREMRATARADASGKERIPRPTLLWIPGGGWRGAHKNKMLGEMTEFARAGYNIVSMTYRTSAQGKFPAQMIDVKTAIRFLRAHADEYDIDPQRIAVFGRSAGGCLAALAAMNTEDDNTGEWPGYSSNVQACCNMFGPVDLNGFIESEMQYHPECTLEKSAVALLMGGDIGTLRERAAAASPINRVNPGMCPMQILHGDDDPLVPVELSSDRLYEKLSEAGMEDQVEYYVIEHAGHGSREFFQDSVKELMLSFFDLFLK